MHPASTRRLRAGARILLAASLTMVVNTACSHAPANEPAQRAEPREREALESLAEKQVIVRVRVRDGTVYVTSRYAVTDSFVVVENVLRGKKYYPDSDEPHLYQRPDPAKQPPADVVLPVRLPLAEVTRVEPWKESRGWWGGFGTGVVLFALISVVVLVLVAESLDQPEISLD